MKCTFRFSYTHFRARRGGPTLGLARKWRYAAEVAALLQRRGPLKVGTVGSLAPRPAWLKKQLTAFLRDEGFTLRKGGVVELTFSPAVHIADHLDMSMQHLRGGKDKGKGKGTGKGKGK